MSAIRIIAILIAIAIAWGLRFGLDASSYVAFPAGVVAYFVVRYGRAAHQNLSWKFGYERGKAGRAWSEPWWVDRKVYGRAYMQGMGREAESKSQQ
jgi:hypothetical protein